MPLLQVWPSRRPVSFPVNMFHNRIVASEEPDASQPLSNTERAWIACACPSKRTISTPAAKSHTRIVFATFEEPKVPELEASRPSGKSARAFTASEWPSRRPISSPLGAFHKRIVPSDLPNTSRPCGNGERARIQPGITAEACDFRSGGHVPQSDRSYHLSRKPAAHRVISLMQ